MKHVALIAALIMQLTNVYGQRSIDRLFEIYAGREGYTAFTMSGNLLNLSTTFDNDDDSKELKANITEVRILARKDNSTDNENFHDMVFKNLKLNDYEEFMRVKEDDKEMRILVRMDGKRIKEFLLVSGGKDNAIIQVRGSMSVKDVKRISDNAGKECCLDIFEESK